MMQINLEINGKTRIIRDIRDCTKWSFDAFYRGCWITISQMDVRFYEDKRPRNSLEVTAPDGCYIVNTWEFADEFTREDLLTMALENILY